MACPVAMAARFIHLSEKSRMKESIQSSCPLVLAMILSGSALSGCTADYMKRSAYDALHRKGCLDRTGVPDCHREYPDFDEYTRERQKVLDADG